MDSTGNTAEASGLLRKAVSFAAFMIRTLLPSALLLFTLLVLTGWIVGDITPFFQWLSWVPASVLLLVLLFAFLLFGRPAGRTGVSVRILTSGLFFFMLAWVCGLDYGFLRAIEAHEDDLVLVNWNATIPPGDESFQEARGLSGEALDLLTSLDGEVVVIFNGSYLTLSSRWESFKSSFAHVTRSGGAMVLSTHEILEVRPILATRGSLVVKIRVRYLGEEMVIWGFDLPSSPYLSRHELFASLKETLGRLNEPVPDLLVGDFNVPRNSQALRRAFPEFRNAFSEAGSGWSGTWPAFFPLWDLDQIRVGSEYSAVRYAVVTPPVGMHRIQSVILRR